MLMACSCFAVVSMRVSSCPPRHAGLRHSAATTIMSGNPFTPNSGRPILQKHELRRSRLHDGKRFSLVGRLGHPGQAGPEAAMAQAPFLQQAMRDRPLLQGGAGKAHSEDEPEALQNLLLP